MLSLFAFLIVTLTFLPGTSVPSPRPPAASLGALVALVLLGGLQLLPLPEQTMRVVAPRNLKIYHETAEILDLFGRRAAAPRVSIAPTETVTVLLLLLAYAGLFCASSSLLETRARRRKFAGALLSSGLLQIVFAAARQSSEGRVHGSFANPDHFAGYLEIVLAVAFGALWSEILTNPERAEEASSRSEQVERRLPALAARVLLWGLIASGIALTESRGGILAAAVTTLVLFLLAISNRRVRRQRKPIAAVAVAILLGVTFVAVAAGAGRFSRFLQLDPRDTGSDSRMAIWKTSIAAWREFPILGSGLGTFREAFRRVQPREQRGLVEQAHNDFLQLAVTGGVVGAAAGVALFLSLLVLLMRFWFRQKHREENAWALAGFGALLTITLHGLIEFSLSIPVIPATLACVLGFAWAAARRT